jgi:4'-phosphopantetheinyl transferase
MSSPSDLWQRLRESPLVFGVTLEAADRESHDHVLVPLLTDLEADRFHALADADRARQFLWGRALVAYVTRSLLQMEGVRLGIGPRGRPYLAHRGSQGSVDLNLAHCRGHVVLALSRDRAVGVDVEPLREPCGVADRFFSQPERVWVAEQGLGRARAFTRLWTIKEACAKADGAGMKPPLQPLVVPLARSGGWAHGRWWEVNQGNAVACAVAVAGPEPEDAPVVFRPSPAEVISSILNGAHDAPAGFGR